MKVLPKRKGGIKEKLGTMGRHRKGQKEISACQCRLPNTRPNGSLAKMSKEQNTVNNTVQCSYNDPTYNAVRLITIISFRIVHFCINISSDVKEPICKNKILKVRLTSGLPCSC